MEEEKREVHLIVFGVYLRGSGAFQSCSNVLSGQFFLALCRPASTQPGALDDDDDDGDDGGGGGGLPRGSAPSLI